MLKKILVINNIRLGSSASEEEMINAIKLHFEDVFWLKTTVKSDMSYKTEIVSNEGEVLFIMDGGKGQLESEKLALIHFFASRYIREIVYNVEKKTIRIHYENGDVEKREGERAMAIIKGIVNY